MKKDTKDFLMYSVIGVGTGLFFIKTSLIDPKYSHMTDITYFFGCYVTTNMLDTLLTYFFAMFLMVCLPVGYLLTHKKKINTD